MLASPFFQLILPYGYAAIFIVIFLAALAIPLPSVSLLLSAAALASQGYFSLPALIVVGIAANIAGDNVSYWLVRSGNEYLKRNQRYRRILSSNHFSYLSDQVSRYPVFIFVSRFFSFLTIFVNIIAALGSIEYWRFLVWESTGEIVSVIIFCCLGYFLGSDWQYIGQLLEHFGIFAVILLALVIIIPWRYRRKR